MPKVKISEFDVNPDNNTDINSINIAEGCAPSGINNAIRQLMSDLKEFQTGAGGDPFNGAVNGTVGATTPSTGAFTSLSASGAFSANGGATLGDASGDALTINSSAVSIPNGLNFGSNNLVLSGGNVGIGTSSSTAYANYVNNTAFRTVSSVSDSSTSSGSNIGQLAIDNLDTTANNYSKLAFTTSDGGNRVVASGIYTQVTARTSGNFVTSNMQFWTGTTGAPPAERMRIDSSGNVGIGHTATSSYGKFSYSSNSGTTVVGGYTDSSIGWWGTGTNHPLAFGVNGTERMRIDSSGNLLVGTTTSTSSGVGPLVLNKSTNSGYIVAYAGTEKAYHYMPSSSRWRGETVTSTTIEFSSGNSNGVTLANGGTSWGSLSDERSKDIIEPITDALNKVSTLRAVIGKYKTEEEGTRRSFLIAQDVQTVLPEAVTENEEGNLILQYTETIPLLVAAIQELKAIVDAQAERIAVLESK